MKLSKSKLKQIIREELANLLEEKEEWILRWSGHGSEYLLSSGEYGSRAKARVFTTKDRADIAAKKVKEDEGYTLMPEKKKDK
jgi:hypothetical protein